MTRMRPEEEWARSLLANALKADVVIHDTGSRSSMYDLHIQYRDGREAAAEVVAAADADAITLWRLMNDDRDERWQVPDLKGGWGVGLFLRARAKRVYAELPRLLKRLENSGIGDLRFAGDEEIGFANQLGVGHAVQSPTAFPGSIYVTLDLPSERSGGMAAESIGPLVEWIGGFLSSGGLADVRRKLAASVASERHAVVFVPSFTTAPFPVMDVLWRDDVALIEDAPILPVEVTDVWAFSSWEAGRAFHWGPSVGWESFKKL